VSKHAHVIEINRHSFSWGIKIEDDEENDKDKKQEKKERKSKGKKAIKKGTSGTREGILEEDSIENSTSLSRPRGKGSCNESSNLSASSSNAKNISISGDDLFANSSKK